MVFYPFYKELEAESKNISTGNFGLWYNKFIPVSDSISCYASDSGGNKNNAVKYYHDQYGKLQKNELLGKLLDKKHFEQAEFYQSFSSRYQPVVFRARLQTPLITGIGESHPHEISMVFDHNMGIPYIPASSIKGIVRLAHTLSLIPSIPEEKIITDEKSEKQYFDDEEGWTNIPNIFGTQKNRGLVFFLDAYPEKIPNLHVDIMNPIYGEYYNDDKNETPPGDYLDPTPLKFLTVAKDTIFMFRALVDKDKPKLLNMVKKAFDNALTQEGIGSKTAVGYGLFDHPEEKESPSVEKYLTKKENDARKTAEDIKRSNMSKDDLMMERISNLQNDHNQISQLVRCCISGAYKNFVYAALKEKLKKLGVWNPSGSKKQKKKIKKRNAEIEAKINC